MKVNTETAVWIGAAAGTVIFFAAGLLPALLYGGYLGVVVGSTLMGGAIEAGGASSILIVIGMAIGAVATWFLFVVAGAAAGALSAWGAQKAIERKAKQQQEEDENVSPIRNISSASR